MVLDTIIRIYMTGEAARNPIGDHDLLGRSGSLPAPQESVDAPRIWWVRGMADPRPIPETTSSFFPMPLHSHMHQFHSERGLARILEGFFHIPVGLFCVRNDEMKRLNPSACLPATSRATLSRCACAQVGPSPAETPPARLPCVSGGDL